MFLRNSWDFLLIIHLILVLNVLNILPFGEIIFLIYFHALANGWRKMGLSTGINGRSPDVFLVMQGVNQFFYAAHFIMFYIIYVFVNVGR